MSAMWLYNTCNSSKAATSQWSRWCELCTALSCAGTPRWARCFLSPCMADINAFGKAVNEIAKLKLADPLSFPHTSLNTLRPYKNTVGTSIVTKMGIKTVEDLYNSRQLLCILVIQRLITQLRDDMLKERLPFANPLIDLLDITLSRLVMQNSSLSRWHTGGAKIEGMFSKQALQIIWDYVEANPLGPAMANWDGAVEWVAKVISENSELPTKGVVVRANAEECPLPSDSADLLFTDPPYFAAIPYADLSDVFYSWFHTRRRDTPDDLFCASQFAECELIVTNSACGIDGEVKDPAFFATKMTRALTRGREVTKPEAIACFVFADNSTACWEAMLSAVIESGWI